ncbi:MAG: hypothetical protein ONB30_08780 [candidate division KSB1 bacterium]|nr:hypothetical protein [candidate division KSB1 bacterium]
MAETGEKAVENQTGAKERWQEAVLLLLLAATLVHIAIYFNRFEVPNTDFFAFRRDALAYMRGDLPENFKRGPVYPLLMGLVSRVLPGSEPELFAGELVNAALTLLLVYLVFRIATALMGSGGVVVAFGVAISPVLMPSATQPLAEASLAVGIALTFYLAMKESPAAYAAAAVASMTRYEAALLLPLLVVKDLYARKRVLPTLMRGAAAATPLALWFVLSLTHKAVLNPYVDEVVKLQPAGVGNLVSCVAISFKFLAPFARRAVGLAGGSLPEALTVGGAGVVLAVVFGGLVLLARKGQAIGWILALFLAGYLVIHTFFWWAIEERYTYIVLWIVLLGVVAVLRELPLPQRALKSGLVRSVLAACTALVAVAGAIAIGLRGGVLQAVVFLLFASAAVVGAFLGSNRTLTATAVVLGVVGVACALGGIAVTANDMAKMRDYRAPYRLAGEWLRAHVEEDVRVVSLLPLTLAYYAGLPDDQVRGYFAFSGASCDDLAARLIDSDVDYVVWDSQAAAEKRAYSSVLHRVDLMRCLFSEEGEPLVPNLSLAAVISVDQKRLRIFRVERPTQPHTG